jgi:queuine/archaeosine tRNA-ribosyltransferase
MITPGKFRYLPAMSPTVPMSILNHIGYEKARKLFWWDEKGFFKNPNLLISAFYGWKMQKSHGRSNRKDLYIPDGCEVFGDSGGYQSKTSGDIITNEQILDWYEDNCDFGFVQDFPLKYIKLKDDIANKKVIMDGFEVTKKMADFQAESNEDFLKRKLTRCKMYNILHGDSLKQLDYWFDTCKNDKMYGWAISTGALDISKITFILAYIYSKGVRKNVHMFGVSRFDMIPVIAHASKYIENITFDSSSWAIGSMYRVYVNPFDIRGKFFIGYKSGEKYTTLPCSCPVCSSITNIKAIYANTGLAGHLISLHNLYHALQFVDRFRSLLQVKEDFNKAVKGMFGDEPLDCIKYFDEAAVDFHKANTKHYRMWTEYNGLFESQQIQTFGQDTLLNELYPEEVKEKKSKKKKKEKEEVDMMEEL